MVLVGEWCVIMIGKMAELSLAIRINIFIEACHGMDGWRCSGGFEKNGLKVQGRRSLNLLCAVGGYTALKHNG